MTMLARALLAAALMLAWLPAPAAARPNLIVIVADDMTNAMLPYMSNVRALAQRGVTLNGMYAEVALCTAARATLLSGRYSHNTGVHRIGDAGRYYGDEENQSIGVTLRDAGYDTGFYGKYLNGYSSTRVPPGWDDWHAFAGDSNPKTNVRINDNGQIRQTGGFMVERLADEAVSFINRPRGSAPFFVYFAAHEPHDPHQPMSGAPGYDNVDAPTGVDAANAYYRGALRALWGFDRQIKRLLDAAPADTVVIFTSDNGVALGERGMAVDKKNVPYEYSSHLPAVIAGPGIPQGVSRPHLMTLADIAPTLYDLAGVNGPAVDGRSIMPVVQSAGAPWRNAIPQHRWASPQATAVRTASQLFIDWSTGADEGPAALRDLAHDLAQCSGAKCRQVDARALP